MIHRRSHLGVLAAVCLLGIVGIVFVVFAPRAGSNQYQHELKNAWSQLSELGDYGFSTIIEQTTYPAPKTTNVGLSSTKDTYHVSGQTDLHNETLQIKLYRNATSLTGDQEDGVEIRLENGVATGRNIGSEEWQTVDSSFISTFAPGNDLSSFLIAARNVSAPENQSIELASSENKLKSFEVSHYQFDLDSDKFAVYMRDQMTAELARTGKLPAGLTLDTSDVYRSMIASGEVWVTQEGYPLRLKIAMQLPEEEDGQRTEISISTDFQLSAAATQLAASSFPEKMSFLIGSLKDDLRSDGLGSTLILLLGTAFFGILMVAFSNSKVIYGGIAVFVILSMAISPIWQSVQASDFNADMQAKQMEQKQNEQDQQAQAAQVAEYTTSSWNPHLSAVEQSEAAPIEPENSAALQLPSLPFKTHLAADSSDEVDTDADGLTDSYEQGFSIHVLNPALADTDSDGLNDSEEVKLGLLPGDVDSDGDGIHDVAEVQPFRYANQDWYSNPSENDTDMDGIPDGVECMERVYSATSTPGICKDTDGDKTPDLFDSDDDGDGVSTISDESPYFFDNTVYSNSAPYRFTVANVESERPVSITYQLQPENLDHLTLAMNVLDWPSNDTEGQIQRISDTTFADQITTTQSEYDAKAAYGDMRLIPMAEIRLSGTSIPLPLTDTFRFSVSADDFTGTFQITDRTSGTTQHSLLTLLSADSGTFQISTAAGTCSVASGMTDQGNFSQSTEKEVNIPFADFADGKYSIFINQGGEELTCVTVPATAHGNIADQVIDATKLNAYGASVRNDTNHDVLVYAPLSLVYDFEGANPTAFAAQVPYSNTGDGFEDSQQEIRVVWLLSMLTDQCKPIPADYDATANGEWCSASQPSHWIQDQTQVVQTYADSYKITGLSVTEDHGVDLDVIFEDPATDSDPTFDDPLWGLSQGLSSTFMTGREDITLDVIQHRFDRLSNSDIPDDDELAGQYQLWGLPRNAFRVLPFTYSSADGIAGFISSQASDILDTYFGSLSTNDAVTLLFAREQSSRGVSYGDSTGQCSGGVCQLDMGASSLQTQAILNWAPYQKTDESWQAYQLEDYLDRLEANLRTSEAYQFDSSSEDERAVVDGKIYMARYYYEVLQKGLATLTRMDSTPIVNIEATLDDQDVFSDFNKMNGKAQIVTKVVSFLTDTLITGLTANPSLMASFVFGSGTERTVSLFKAIGKGISEKTSAITKYLTTTFRKVAAGAVAVIAVIAIVTITLLYLIDTGTAGKVAERILFTGIGAVTLGLAIYGLYSAVQLLRAAKTISTAARSASVIGAVIGAVITWGIFIYQWAASGVSFGSLAFNNMIADAIAATMLIVLMTALACTGVGAIIVGVIAVIDALISTICAAAGANDLDEDHWARQYVCIGISGWITKIFKWALYSNTYLIDYDDSSRLEFKDIDQRMRDESLGMSESNDLAYSIQVENTITKSNLPFDWKALLYAWQFSNKYVKSTTFAYALKSSETDIHGDLERYEIDDWKEVQNNKKWEKTFTASTGSTYIDMPSAGINVDPTVYFTEGSAVPVQECWALWSPWGPIPICYIRTERASFSIAVGDSMTVDVFPSTLDEFYSLEATSNGYRLDWNSNSTLSFPTMKDADGDGLLSKAFTNGNDPDDTLYDTDGDGLSDAFEVANGTDPRLVDTDDDGLFDYDEISLSTDPLRKDTDGDGLPDREEVDGWMFTYGFEDDGTPLETMVYPDPLYADTDSDGVTDFLERVYGFNPRVADAASVLEYALSMRELDSPLVLIKMDETGSANTFIDSSNFGFNATCQGDQCPVSGLEGRVANTARFNGSNLLALPSSMQAITLGDNQPFTLAAWVNNNENGTLIAKWASADSSKQEVRLELANGVPTLTSSNASVSANTAVSSGDWNHVAAIFNGSQVQFVINGAAVGCSGSCNWSSPTAADQTDLASITIGGTIQTDSVIAGFNGLIDEAAIFDRALSVEEVAQRLMPANYNLNDQFVRPGEEIAYTSVVTNLLNSRFAYGLLNTLSNHVEAIMNWAQEFLPYTFVLYPDNPAAQGVNVATIDNTIQIDPSYSQSGEIEISQTAQVQIVDRRTESNRAELWLKFDEGVSTTTYEDSSGSMPPRTGTCTNCPQANTSSILNSGVTFASGGNTPIALDTLAEMNMLNSSYTLSMWVNPAASSTPGASLTLLASDTNALSLSLARISNTNYNFTGRVNNTALSFTRPTSTFTRDVTSGTWNLITFVYDLDARTFSVYINGALGYIATNVSAIQSDGALTLGGTSQAAAYSVDDLRIYSRGLSSVDINELAERPVLVLNMDNAQFSDTSGYQQSVGIPKQAPIHSSSAVQGTSLMAGSGSSTGFINVSGNAQLDLQDGAFTISTWVYPTGSDTSTWQGIFGYRENLEGTNDLDAYPTLERKGTDLRFSYGTGSEYISVAANSTLTTNRWNYVTITFNPTDDGRYLMELYVNAVVKVSQLLNDAPTSGTYFYVGHSSPTTRFNVGNLYMDDEHDAGSHAEPYIELYINGNYSGDIMSESMGDGDVHNVNYHRLTNSFDNVHVEVWEDDTTGDDHCGDYYTNWYGAPYAGSISLSDGFDGSLNVSFERASLPFSGQIDEMAVYRYALDSQQIYDLYNSIPVTAQLTLDDRPASTSFENSAAVGGENDADCTQPGCPAAGTIGLINQAVRFDGVDDTINVPVVTTADTMVSLWLNTTCPNCGIYTLNSGATTLSQIYLRSGNVCTLTNSIELCSTGGGASDAQWHHVLYSYNATEASLRLDGTLVNQRRSNPALNPASNGQAILGIAAEADQPNFFGQLDDVRVFRYSALDQLDSLLKRAPVFLAHLDETNPSGGMSDATLTHWTMECSGAACPTSAPEGRLGTALEFDGIDDRVNVVQDTLSSDLTDFSQGLWVMPSRKSSTSQVLWALNRADNTAIKYALTLPADSLRVCVMTGDDTSSCASTSYVDLIQDSWNYVMLTVHRDGSNNETYSLYINGYLDSIGQGNVGSSAGAGKLTFGNNPATASFGGGAFAGKVDEPTLYRYQLSENDVTATFNYQMGSVEETSTLTMTVDADNPTVDLASYDSTFPYIPNADRLLQVNASDATSGVARVEMETEHTFTSATTYRNAPVCQDSGSGTAYCPTFIPTAGEGQYNLIFRAVDQVGHSNATVSYPLIVDATAPRVVTNMQEDQLISSNLASWAKNTWYVGLSGSISDEELLDGTPGSGINTDSLVVTLYSEAGEIVGAGPQKPLLTATATGYSWALNYIIPETEPTGRLLIVVEVQDRVGNLGNRNTHILLDATAPVSTLNQSDLPGVEGNSIQIDSTVTATMLKGGLINGSASDIPTSSAPYLTENGLNAASAIQQVDVSLTPALNASYLFNQPYPKGILVWLPLDSEEVPNDNQGQPNEDSPYRMFIDISPYQINGTCTAEECPKTGTKGHVSGSIYFDGQDRAINLGQQVDLSNRSFSISIWAKAESIDRSNAMLWQGPASIVNQRFLLGLNTSNQFVCGFGGTDLVSSAAYTDLDWHQWTCTYNRDSGERIIYRDGQEIGRDSASALPSMNENLYVGSAPVGSFSGYLDELIVLDHALDAAGVRQQYTGYQTIFSLGVQEKYLVSGDTLVDESGFYHTLALTNAQGSLANKVDAGQVGNYSLSLDGRDTLDVTPAFSLGLDRGEFTLSAWVKPEAGSALRDVISQREENPERRYPSLSITASGQVSTGFGDGYGWVSAETGSGLVPDGVWSNVTVTYAKNTFTIYVNGNVALQTQVPDAGLPYGSQHFVIGDDFKGHLDEIQIFARAISSEEVTALTQKGWQAATIEGAGNEMTWSSLIPNGLEGPYQINTRAWDGLGHYSTEGETLNQWGGVVDTLNPRLTVQRSLDADDETIAHYTFSIQDLTLDESSIHMNICEDAVIQREYYNSPWYLASGFAPNTSLYRITGTCDGPTVSKEEVGIWVCDLSDNCSSQTYPANPPVELQIFLPLIFGGTGNAPTQVDGNYNQPSEATRNLAQSWPELNVALTGELDQNPPALTLTSDVLTLADQRSQAHLNIQGRVISTNEMNSITFTVSQAGEVVFSGNASVFGEIWNANWVYPVGNAPADGTYTLTVVAVDQAGQTSELTQDITVQLSNP